MIRINKDTKLGEDFQITSGEMPEEAKPLEMIWIPGGTFSMRIPDTNIAEYKQFPVTLTDGFWIGKYAVTVAHWFTGLEMEGAPERHVIEAQANYPIHVNWYQALTYCWELNRSLFVELESLQTHGYRFTLPSESQWEYACRAGTQTRYYNGDDETNLHEIAWYAGSGDAKIHPVGQKEPNSWGLHDMLGNTSEWCLDTHGAYPQGETENWVQLDGNPLNLRVLRGGLSTDDAKHVQCTQRDYQPPIASSPGFGFRLCLSNLAYQLNL